MTNFLQNIINNKIQEIEFLKYKYPLSSISSTDDFLAKSKSAKKCLLKKNTSGIIAEFKRKSPSKGTISNNATVCKIIPAYEEAGASMVSVLTDKLFFGAKKDDFNKARNSCSLPILRKDFIIDEYQIYETKVMQADVILLIADIIDSKKCRKFTRIAKSINLEVLLEIHKEEELDYITPDIDLVGVNNRNLTDFKVDINNSITLASKIPSSFIKITESGLQNHKEILILRQYGFLGFLIGEKFMKTPYPGLACSKLIDKLK